MHTVLALLRELIPPVLGVSRPAVQPEHGLVPKYHQEERHGGELIVATRAVVLRASHKVLREGTKVQGGQAGRGAQTTGSRGVHRFSVKPVHRRKAGIMSASGVAVVEGAAAAAAAAAVGVW